MRNGFKVYDADTHVRPSAEAIRPFLSSTVLDRIPDLEEHRTEIKIGRAGEVREPPYRHWYHFERGRPAGWSSLKPRVLGEAEPREVERGFQTFMGSRYPTEGVDDWDSASRLRDMDEEGTDVQFIVHTAGPGHPETDLEMEFVRAEHRYLDDFCGKDPHRLKSCLTITPRDIEGSIAEIKTWGKAPWAVAIHPKLAPDYPIDHPDLHPIWAAAQEENLAVIHHSVGAGYPGNRDLWNNPFLGRLCSHPWFAMRNLAAFVGSGLLDRFPNLRYGILESGFGFLPFWGKRMDDQAVYMGYVPENLEYKMSEYLTGGRFFAAIVIHEGPETVKMVTDYMGDHVLMFGSDYPHSESRFPDSVDIVASWNNLPNDQMQKLFWDNPVRFFGEP